MPYKTVLILDAFFAVATFFVVGFVTFPAATFLVAGFVLVVAVLEVVALGFVLGAAVALVVLAADFLAFPVFPTPPSPFAALAAINSNASSNVMTSGDTPLGNVALILPWRAYGP